MTHAERALELLRSYENIHYGSQEEIVRKKHEFESGVRKLLAETTSGSKPDSSAPPQE